jgi:predicted nuclease with TOPRIM domain
MEEIEELKQFIELNNKYEMLKYLKELRTKVQELIAEDKELLTYLEKELDTDHDTIKDLIKSINI